MHNLHQTHLRTEKQTKDNKSITIKVFEMVKNSEALKSSFFSNHNVLMTDHSYILKHASVSHCGWHL